jgi:hypothetical protein
MDLIRKMIGASKLDINLYDEVESNPDVTKEAFLAVLLVSISTGIGMIGISGSIGIITGLVSSIIAWVLWSVIIYVIGVRGFGHSSDLGELLRCLGFAYSPGILNIFMLLPFIGHFVPYVTSIWVFLTFIVAIRQALDCETSRAILISVLGFLAYVIIRFLIFFI